MQQHIDQIARIIPIASTATGNQYLVSTGVYTFRINVEFYTTGSPSYQKTLGGTSGTIRLGSDHSTVLLPILSEASFLLRKGKEVYLRFTKIVRIGFALYLQDLQLVTF